MATADPPGSPVSGVRHSRGTGVKCENMFGEKLYQRLARVILPILVRQARAAEEITYGDLAQELGISSARNLNYPLGSIARTLDELSNRWGWRIPAIHSLVVNSGRRVPGSGFGTTTSAPPGWERMDRRSQQRYLRRQLHAPVFDFPDWDLVLKDLGLKPLSPGLDDLVARAASRAPGGEGPEHDALKRYIAAHPRAVGLPDSAAPGEIEVALPSGDTIDVLFRTRSAWVGVEVKSHISDDADLARGVFQCVKYRAVLDALAVSQGRQPAVRCLLAVGRGLDEATRRLKNLLGIEVREGIAPPGDGPGSGPGG